MTAPNTYTQSDDLSQPLYGASFGQAVARFFKKYATFSGRASRSEFWWWFLVTAIVNIVISIVSNIGGPAATFENGTIVYGPGYGLALTLNAIWFLATIVPWLALAWRRLHDSNKPGPFWFLGLIPFVGPIILLVFFLLPSDPAGARFDRR